MTLYTPSQRFDARGLNAGADRLWNSTIAGCSPILGCSRCAGRGEDCSCHFWHACQVQIPRWCSQKDNEHIIHCFFWGSGFSPTICICMVCVYIVWFKYIHICLCTQRQRHQSPGASIPSPSILDPRGCHLAHLRTIRPIRWESVERGSGKSICQKWRQKIAGKIPAKNGF